jgi:hypothetical protein
VTLPGEVAGVNLKLRNAIAHMRLVAAATFETQMPHHTGNGFACSDGFL